MTDKDSFISKSIPVSLNTMLSTARMHIGAKWRHLGRNPWAIDCIGLIIVSFRSGGIYLHNVTHYKKEPWNDGLEDYLLEHFGNPLPVNDRRIGDVLLMWDERQPAPAHLAIVSGNDTIIHSFSEEGVIEHRIDDVWLRRIVGVYRPNWGTYNE